MKNLILIHLESISNVLLWQYRVELGTIWELMRRSLFYSNFQTSATSTEMSLVDLTHGASGYFDHLPVFGKPASSPLLAGARRISAHLALDFKYDWLRYCLDYLLPPGVEEPYPGMIRFSARNEDVLFDHLRRSVAERTKRKKPFMLHFSNNISHMALDNADTVGKGLPARFSGCSRALDSSIARVFAVLKEAGVWDNCVIACYGDHGDELWSHGVNKGYCHCLAPYATQTWTPFFIYEDGKPPGVFPGLVSMIDVKQILLERLSPGYRPKHPRLPPSGAGLFPGMNSLREPRQFAFSQNLFVLQREYSDPERGLTKGYAMTDGVYRIVASSGGKDSRSGGMEFFYDRGDPFNIHNLLRYVVMNSKGRAISGDSPTIGSDSAMTAIMGRERVKMLVNRFNRLRDALHETVRKREAECLKHNGACGQILPERVFERRKRLPRA